MEFTVVEGWLHLLGSGAVNSDRGCRNAEEPASVRSFARRKCSSAVNHLPDFSYAIALGEAPSPICTEGTSVLAPSTPLAMLTHPGACGALSGWLARGSAPPVAAVPTGQGFDFRCVRRCCL